MKLLIVLIINCFSFFNYVYPMYKQNKTQWSVDVINRKFGKSYEMVRVGSFETQCYEDLKKFRKKQKQAIIFTLLLEEHAFQEQQKAERRAIREKKEAEERVMREKKECVDNLMITLFMSNTIESLPNELQDFITQHFVYYAQQWYQKDLEIKYVWGSVADLSQKRAQVFLLPSGNGFYNRATRESFALKAHDGWVHTALWNANKTQLLTASGDRRARLFDVYTGKKLAELVHDAALKCAFFAHDTLSGLRAGGTENNMKIVTYDYFNKKNHTWERYNFTFEQALLYKFLYTWLLVCKIDKSLVGQGYWSDTDCPEDDDELVSFIKSIEAALLYSSFGKKSLVSIWKTIINSVRKNIWEDIRRIVQRHGKISIK